MIIMMYRFYKTLKNFVTGQLGLPSMNKRYNRVVISKADRVDIRRLEATTQYLKDTLVQYIQQSDGMQAADINTMYQKLLNPDRYRNQTVDKNSSFIFICGLHRSGTSLLAQTLRGHPDISGFSNTIVPEDEGQFLQTVYPADSDLGRPGLFGFLKESHLTEASPLATERSKNKILRQWSEFWDLDKKIFIEKSPSNILRTRFLQELFPNSKFIIVKRHPVANALATQKWAKASAYTLLLHWLTCYRVWNKDKLFIKNYIEISYENLCKNTADTLDLVCDFIGASKFDKKEVKCFDKIVKENVNEKYFSKWKSMKLQKNICEFSFDKEINTHGYSLCLLDIYPENHSDEKSQIIE